MKTEIVIGDIHSRWEQVRKLLAHLGALALIDRNDPSKDRRMPGFNIIQLGDAVSLGYGEPELDFYNWWSRIVQPDIELIGNHELPAFYWNPDAVMFTGWHHKYEIDEYWQSNYHWETGRDEKCVQRVRERYNQGAYQAATNVGDWLITHAGLAGMYDHKELSSQETSIALNNAFTSCQSNQGNMSMIDNTSQSNGGIFWHRMDYLRNGYDNDTRKRRQIVGHTSPAGPKRYGNNLICIDSPSFYVEGGVNKVVGGVSAFVTDDHGETYKLVTCEAVTHEIKEV